MEEEKSLQKVTDFGSIVDVESFKKYMKENHLSADEIQSLFKYLQDKMSDSYVEYDGKESDYLDILIYAFEKFEGTKKRAENIKNLTYEVNQQIISTCIHNYIGKHGCFPQVTTIRRETGLSRTTIYRHLKLDDYTPKDKLIKGKFDIMAAMALEQLYKIGIEQNSHAALKTFIEMVNGTNGVKTVNNYIQINNITLSQEEFISMPAETQHSIEKIIEDVREQRRLGIKKEVLSL